MTDFFQSRRFGREVENLYLYSTLMRMVYQHDAVLWGQLVAGSPLCTGYEDHPSTSLLVPGWAILRGTTGCIVVVQGTANGIQFAIQFFGAIQAMHPPFPGWQNEFPFQLYEAVQDPIFQAIAAGQHDNITIVGHSLGGAIALLLGWDFNSAFGAKFNGVITEACPKVGSLDFAQGLNFPILRLENQNDPVPNLPPAANLLIQPSNVVNVYSIIGEHYAHAGAFYTLRPNGNISCGYGEEVTGGFPHLSIPVTAGVIDNAASFVHDSDEYTRRIRLRLLRAPGMRRLQSPLRGVLDTINTTLNLRAGKDWGLHVPSGELSVWQTEVLGPAPPQHAFVNAIDP